MSELSGFCFFSRKRQDGSVPIFSGFKRKHCTRPLWYGRR